MKEAHIDIGGSKKTFTIGKLNAIEQLHVMRRFGPCVADIFSLNESQASDTDVYKSLTEELAKLSDEDFEYCIYKLIGCIQLKNGPNGPFTDLVVNNSFPYDWIDAMSSMRLAWEAIQVNFGNFISSLQQDAPTEDLKQKDK